MSISTIIFDLGNVLVHNHPERAAERFSELNGKSLEENMEIMVNHNDYMRGEVSPKEFAQQYIRKLSIPISEQDFHKIYVDIFDLNVPMFDLVKKLKDHYQIILLSNAEKETIVFLEKKFADLFKLFKHRIYSFDLNLLKPEKEIFLHALKLAKAKPKETVFIDDMTENTEGAKKLGIHGIRYTQPAALKKELKELGLQF